MAKHLLKYSRLAVLATMALGCGVSVSHANCELFERLSVSLLINGQPGDAFRIIGRCGDGGRQVQSRHRGRTDVSKVQKECLDRGTGRHDELPGQPATG